MQITVLWIIAGVLVELNNAINYDVTTRSHYFHFIFGNNAFEHLLITASGPLVGGLFAGSFIVFYLTWVAGMVPRRFLLQNSVLKY